MSFSLLGRAGAVGGAISLPTAVRANAIRPYTHASSFRHPPTAPSGYPFQYFWHSAKRTAVETQNFASLQRLGTVTYVMRNAKNISTSIPLARPHRSDGCACRNHRRRPFLRLSCRVVKVKTPNGDSAAIIVAGGIPFFQHHTFQKRNLNKACKI